MNGVNRDVADRLDETARLLQEQGADRYRIGAYARAAASIRSLPTPVENMIGTSPSMEVATVISFGRSL